MSPKAENAPRRFDKTQSDTNWLIIDARLARDFDLEDETVSLDRRGS